jgi:hypothetical protein
MKSTHNWSREKHNQLNEKVPASPTSSENMVSFNSLGTNDPFVQGIGGNGY